MEPSRQPPALAHRSVRLAPDPVDPATHPRRDPAGGPPAWWKSVQPFLLLLATALVSGYLLPQIDRARQDHQRALELKTELVDTVSESVAHILLAVQFAESGYSSQSQEEFDAAYREWETDKLRFAGRLRAYFAGGEVDKEWARFSGVVTEVYALSGTTDPEQRAARINRLKRQLGSDAAEWETLMDVESRSKGYAEFQRFYGAWFSLREAVYTRLDAFLETLLAAQPNPMRS